MLRRGEHPILLDPTDERGTHASYEVRLLAKGARADHRVLRVVVYVEHGREGHVDAERAAFERGDAPHLVGERRVARGADAHLIRKCSGTTEVDCVGNEVAAT